MRTGACFFVAIILLGCGRTDVYWYQPGEWSGEDTDPPDTETDNDTGTETDTDTGPAPEEEPDDAFRAIWAMDNHDIWVGGTGDAPFVHWNGGIWQEIYLGETDVDIYAISGTGYGHINAAGDCEPESTPPLGGARSACVWSVNASTTPLSWSKTLDLEEEAGTRFAGAWSLSLVDSYTVGKGAAHRNNGFGWESLDDLLGLEGWASFTTVFGTAGNNVFVGGENELCEGGEECGGLLHWDGYAWSGDLEPDVGWSQVSVPTDLVVKYDEVFFVTDAGWLCTVEAGDVDCEEVHDAPLEGVLVLGPDEVWVAGRGGFVARRLGAEWAFVELGEHYAFEGIWGYGSTTEESKPVIWLVGARRLGPGQWIPIVARFDEGGWAEVYP